MGALNLQDLIITNLFRGTQVDLDDCMAAFEKSGMDPDELLKKKLKGLINKELRKVALTLIKE